MFIFLVIFGLILWNRRDDIRAFWWPSDWVEVEMLELDNNTRTWLQQKTPNLKFKFNEGLYNMYHPVREDGVIKRMPSIYRSGRLAKFFYQEGREDPLDLRTKEIDGNPQVNEQILKIDVGRFFDSVGGLGQELMQKYGIFILLGLGLMLIVIIFLLLQKPEAAAAVKGG